MKHKYFFKLFIFASIFITSSAWSQTIINDNFDDGDLSGWTEGTASDWANSTDSFITGTNSLKHNLSSVSGSSYIYHSTAGLDLTTKDATWQFNLKNGSWDPSGSNKFWIFLTANETDLSSATVDGYAVGVNLTGSTDILTLWKVTDGAADGAIITSSIDWNSSNTKGIKITRSTSGAWNLSVDADGGFDSLVSEGNVTNTDYTFSNYFGLEFFYTSSRAGLLWLDDVLVEGTTPSSSPAINFDNASSSENETDATFNTTVPVSMTNHSSDVTISVSVDGSSSAPASDYTLNTTSLTFTGDETKNISIDIKDDADYISETVILNIAVTSGTADISIAQHTITINDDDTPIVINEILADPDAANGDANGDGNSSTSQDEFIEIYNISGSDLDISNWVLSDGASDRHTFPNGTIIPANDAIVLFSGGNPATVPGLTQVASTGALGLNNGGDTITVKDDSGNSILVEVYGAAGNNQSIARDPDLTGSFVDHSDIASNPVLFSPGRDNTDNSSFTSIIKWTGATDNNWNTATNWLDSSIPSSSSNIIIPSGLTNYPTISSVTTASSITIESGASLVANATVTGSITYKRSLTGNWHLVSSPVNGETVQDLIANHTFAVQGGSNITMAPYNNGGTAWDYYTEASTGSITSGSGLSVKLASADHLNFTGTLNTSNVTPAITQGGANNFNLIGNPFTSYVTLGTFFSNNTGKFTEETIWMWNQATSSYDLKMSGTDDAFEIAPGQGFFVSANADTTINFNANDQSHQTDTFQRSARTEINLTASENGKSKSTKIYFIDGTTKGFDNGYDGTAFSTSNKFALYSQLVTNNQGKNYAIQSLPLSDIENIAIPIGLNALASKKIQFYISSNNLPNNTKVYLEDRLNNELVDITDTAHTITLKNDVNGIGQFYLRATSQKIDAPIATSIEEVSIYKSAPNTLSIIGLQTEKSSLKIYSLMGQKVADQNFNSNGFSNIAIPSLATGIYVIELSSELGKTSRKIILE